jgi:hypothetical protein
MAKGKRKARAEENAEAGRGVSAENKIARLLGLLLVKDIKKKTDQVPLLRSAGFGVSEVADMLGMTEKHVTVAHVQGRKKKKSR